MEEHSYQERARIPLLSSDEDVSSEENTITQPQQIVLEETKRPPMFKPLNLGGAQHEEIGEGSSRHEFGEEGNDLQPQPQEEFRTYGNKAPVQLLKINKDGKLELCQEGLNVLLNITERVKIVSMAGPSRTGKSYALNLLADKVGSGFQVSGLGDACTQGVWIWGDPADIEDGKLILLDTEGSRSTQKDPKHDAKIFAFSVLLSSLFLYNTKNSIDEIAIRELSLAAYISDFISYQVEDQDTAEEVKNRLAANAPKFCWIIRDFFLDLEGQSPKEFMESILGMTNYRRRDKETFDKARDAVTAIFKDRNCICLPTPMDEIKDLQNLDNIPESRLKPAFLQYFSKLRAEIYQSGFKKLNGIELTGITAASLAIRYIDAINEKGVSNINSTWDAVVSSEYERMFNEAKNLFGKNKKFHLEQLPYEEAELTVSLSQAKDKSLAIFKMSSLKNDKLERHFVEQFEIFFDSEMKYIKVANENSSEGYNKSLISNVFADIFKRLDLGEYTQEIEQLHSDSGKALEEYLNKAKGPTKLAVMVQFTQSNNPKIFSSLVSEYKNSQEQEIRKKLEEQGYNEEQLKQQKEALLRETESKRRIAELNAEMKETDAAVKRQELQDQLDAIANENDELKQQLEEKREEYEELQKRKQEINPPDKKKQGGCKCEIF